MLKLICGLILLETKLINNHIARFNFALLSKSKNQLFYIFEKENQILVVIN